MKVIDSKRTAAAIAMAASSKKALDIVTIDIRKMPSVADYFIIASGKSTTQVRAISDNIIKRLREDHSQKAWHVEGEREASWILLDYGDVVAHVFLEETRCFYDLERLWSDAPQKRFKEKKRAPKRTPRVKNASKRNRR